MIITVICGCTDGFTLSNEECIKYIDTPATFVLAQSICGVDNAILAFPEDGTAYWSMALTKRLVNNNYD